MKLKNMFTFLAALGLSLQVAAYVPPPLPPDYKNCPITQVSNVITNSDGSSRTEVQSVVDQNCVRNTKRQYDAMVTANGMANNLVVDPVQGVIAPVKPTYETCDNDSKGNLDYACLNNNATKLRAYNERMDVYSRFKAAEASGASQQQFNLDARAKGSITEKLAEAEGQANLGNQQQSKISSIAMGSSITFAGLWAMSCARPFLGCEPSFAAASAAAALVSYLTGKQANIARNQAVEACRSYNQMASQPKECGEPPPPFDPTKPSDLPVAVFPYGQVDPKTGTCLPSAPATCQKDLSDAGNKGINIKDVLKKGPSSFAGPNSPFKLNKDGSVTMKDGKTYKPEDFASKEAMIAAGMSPKDALAVSSELYGKDGVYAKAGLDPKADLMAMPKSLGAFDMGAGGSSTVKGALDDREKLGLGTKEDGSGASRKPTGADSEGLVKDFNGDLIGISNDNIFMMMNKRYILKSAQDSFIGQ